MSTNFLFLGLPTWALVDGTWAVLASIALESPQGFYISSYLTLSLTLGNVIPLIAGQLLRNTSIPTVYSIIMGILSVGLICGALMAFFWSQTVTIYGRLYSLPLFLLFFIVGSCSSTSNVTHYIFVSKFSPYCTTILSFGMAVGSMIAGLLGLAHGLYLYKYGFSVMWYFLCLTSFYILAIFFLMRIKSSPSNSTIFEKDVTQSFTSDNYIAKNADDVAEILIPPLQSPSSPLRSGYINSEDFIAKPTLFNTSTKSYYNQNNSEASPMIQSPNEISHVLLPSSGIDKYKIFFIAHFINSVCGYGVIPSLISVASSKFRDSAFILQLATGIACSLDPVGRYITGYFRIGSWKEFLFTSLLILLLTLSLLVITLVSPDNHSRLFNSSSNFVPITIYVCCSVLFGFSTTCMFRYFKDRLTDSADHHLSASQQFKDNTSVNSVFDVKYSYRVLGMVSQGGALTGSILIFTLIYFEVF